MQLTPEQGAVLDTNIDIVINAVAGSGKTTTLIEYARTRTANSRILYLAFNKTVKTEAVQKFVERGVTNVQVETAHSLAFDYIVKHSSYKVVAGYKSYEWSQMLGIKTGDRHADFILANHVNKFISLFCNSKAAKVQELNYADVITDPKAKLFVHNFYSSIEKYTREALAKMDKGEISVTHDFYLKKFQLSNPVLPYDYILFDEGQDASAAMLDVFLKQKSIKIIVGDMHQQIYGWRYAINSLQQVEFPVHHLSNSFRFDEEVALIANKILAWKKHLDQPAAVKIIGAGNPFSGQQTTEAGTPERTSTKATLGRTNLSLLLNAISQWQHGNVTKLFFEGNINSYTFAEEGASLYDVLDLYNGKTGKIRDKLIAEMKSMKELEDYIEKTEDTSLSMIVEVVKEFGNKLPFLISELKKHHTTSKEEADVIFSTVHRCKGMEYDEVTLLNDFITEEKLRKYIKEYGGEKMDAVYKNRLAEEVNILYVAVTRAKNKLSIPAEINPLRSIELSAATPSFNRGNNRVGNAGDWDLYSRSMSASQNKSPYSKTTNHGKRWTEEEEDELAELFSTGITFKEIAKKLGRGENGVRMKLMNLGLLDEKDEDF